MKSQLRPSFFFRIAMRLLLPGKSPLTLRRTKDANPDLSGDDLVDKHISSIAAEAVLIRSHPQGICYSAGRCVCWHLQSRRTYYFDDGFDSVAFFTPRGI
ncbi:hypothetical protein [Microbulbifer pacificus]|uniref:hypothetical protein n=1 Tax=Microbulbifer pacificus TaxID=407164 RepID=UPI001319D807|nr:hypothetical protein [Microbulbifer pacificus]